MIKITESIEIDENLLQEDFVRASGPGGQNVNKVSTAVQLRFNLKKCQSIPDEIKKRIKKLAGRRYTNQGILIIEAKKYRTQERNREDAMHRLKKLFLKASVTQKKRKSTKPHRGAVEQRLQDKKHKKEIKKTRQKTFLKDE